MSAKAETAIWLALKSRIDTLMTSTPKAWPAMAFTAPSGATGLQAYLRIGRVMAAPVRMVIAHGKPHDRTGFLMITLVQPMTMQNTSMYDQLAGTIAEHFKDGTQASFGGVCVTVTSYPHIMDGYEDAGYWAIPVRIPWRCFI